MRRFLSVTLIVGMAYIIILGCARQAPSKEEPVDNKPVALLQPAKQGQGAAVQDEKEKEQEKEKEGANEKEPAVAAADDKQEKYEAALGEALNLLADQKLPQALIALETAQTFQDNEFIQGEIARIKGRIEQETAAQKTVQNIETILDEGKPGEAAKLAQEALKEFGDRSVAELLIKLRLEAEALNLAAKNEVAADRYQRFRDEGEAALTEKNLRAAALAFEQALSAKEDARLKEQLAEIRGDLEKYDRLRRRAADLRRDPAQLEDAIEALREAAKAWDTVQVREDIDEYTLALQKRRDNVSVADFEVRGDIGLPEAGPTFAEELLPHLKPRFDLVERNQLAKVLDELKLEAGFLDDPEQQRELSRLAKVRYLVLGSVSRLSGVTVNARLVDARTGLIVQTARIVAPSAEDAVKVLPELARQLMMSDEEKQAYDQKQMQLAKRPEPVEDDAPLPAPPAAPEEKVPPPPPLEVDILPPPPPGGLKIDAFQNLPPPPPAGKVMILQPAPVQAEVRVKNRLLHAVLHLGDNLFRRGNYHEAQRHFEFALNLSPGNFDLALRLERVRPLVPPPVIVVEQPVFVARPRVAIVNFLVVGDAIVVPPSLGPWTAYNITPYFRNNFEIVDQNEVYWYMARMGMSLRDLMEDPSARRWLGRALNVRYFVLGTIQQTASFDVTTFLLDAEYGFLQGRGHVHVRNAFELRMRLGELVALTLMDPAERTRYLAGANAFDVLVARGRQLLDRRLFSEAAAAFEEALRLRPGYIPVIAYLNQARWQARQYAWEEERRRRFLQQQAAEEEARRRAWLLARAAERARIRAVADAALWGDDQRRLQEEQRRRAHLQLLAQARFAVQGKNFAIALNAFEGALRLGPANDDILREVAVARAERDKTTALQVALAASQREAALRKQREIELEKSRNKLEAERSRAVTALEVQKKVQLERDKAAYQRAFDEGQRLLAKKDYDAAIAMLQLARQPAQQIGKADVVELLLQRALVEQAKGDKSAELEKRLAAERARRKQAEAEAKRNQELYQSALELAHKALANKNFEVAQAKYQEAGAVFKTDAVLTGLRSVETARSQVAAAKKKTRDDEQRGERLKKLLADGQSALAAKKPTQAMDAFLEAKKLAPENLDVLAGLTRAEQARDKALAEARRKNEETDRARTFQKLIQSGQDNLTAKQYDAAIANLAEAVQLNPDDAKAKTLLKQAEKARDALLSDKAAREEARKKTEAYQKLIGEGRLALEAKRFDDAIQAFAKAQKVLPGDKSSTELLKEAQSAKQAAKNALALEAKKRAEELQRAADLKKALDQGRTALAAKNLANAEKAFNAAAKLAPEDPAVIRALSDLQQARKQAKAEADDSALKAKLAQERAAKLKEHLSAGRAALKAKKLEAAAEAFAQARALAPKDPQVLDALSDLEQARKSAGAAQEKDAARLQEFNRLLKEAAADFKTKNYADAKKAYADALKLFPSDKAAQAGYQQASKALEASKTKDPPKKEPPLKKDPPKKDPKKDLEAEFQKEMQNAATLEKQKKYAEALKTYKDALRLDPDDAKAKEGARRTEYIILMQDGQRFLELRQFQQAVSAFEAALRLFPNSDAAKKLLAKAKAGGKK